MFVKGFFPFAAGFAFCSRVAKLGGGCTELSGARRQERAGAGCGMGQGRGCAAEGFLDSPRLEESSNWAGKTGFPLCLHPQLLFERRDPRRK